MNESVMNEVVSMSYTSNGYHWKGFIRFDNIGQDVFRPVLIGNGRNPERIGKARYSREELADVYTRFIENGYSFTHFSVKEGNTVRNWRTGKKLCTAKSFLDSILIANRYSISYELKRVSPVDIETEFEHYQSAQAYLNN
jgi:hypothetical protein